VVGRTSFAALALSGALAAPAAAQVIAVNGACFVNANPSVGAPVTVSGSGFAPGDTVDLVDSKGVVGTTTVGTAGTFTSAVAGPTLSTASPASARFTLTARDETNGTTTASTSFLVANLAFQTRPASAKPSDRVHFSFSGFRPGALVYGHYVHAKKVVTARFGRAKGACGLLNSKARLFPGRPRFSNYKVQFDDSRRYHSEALPRIISGLTIEHF
jgi:hypothetical protein